MAFSSRMHIEEKTYQCAHCSQPVVIESKIVYPSDLFREMPQRIAGRSCNHEFDCVLMDKSACPMKLLQIRGQIFN